MKRNLELVRLLLLEIEKHNDPTRTVEVTVEGYSPLEVAYHLKLLKDGGLIVARNLSTETQMAYRPKSLTWAGHEFLDATRNDTVWRQIQARLKDSRISVPMSLIEQMALQILKGMIQ